MEDQAEYKAKHELSNFSPAIKKLSIADVKALKDYTQSVIDLDKEKALTGELAKHVERCKSVKIEAETFLYNYIKKFEKQQIK